MPKASEHKSAEFTKLLIMGPSGTGKTGGLLSLLRAGYEVGVIDMDNGLDWLINYLKKYEPQLLDLLSYQTFRDKFKMSAAGPVYEGIPNAYTKAVQALGKWDDGTSPQEWGAKKILALDSLTFFGQSAFHWKDALNPGAKDKRTIYFDAQTAVGNILDTITSDAFRTNVMVFTHVRWKTVTDDKGNTTTLGGAPSSIGEALSEKIGTYFNTVGRAESINGKRQITFKSDGMFDLKTSAVGLENVPLPLETAYAKFFEAARG